LLSISASLSGYKSTGEVENAEFLVGILYTCDPNVPDPGVNDLEEEVIADRAREPLIDGSKELFIFDVAAAIRIEAGEGIGRRMGRERRW